MQTAFSDEQRRDPDIRTSEAALRRCVHCGFCTATCPTYVLDGNELDGPRGRIMLIQAMLEAGGAPDPAAVMHIDRCLSCGSCVSTCPSGVTYSHLVDHARAHIETHFKRPFFDRIQRMVFGHVLPRPSLFRSLLFLGRIARPLQGLMPGRLRGFLSLVPTATRRRARAEMSTDVPTNSGSRPRVVLFKTCVQDAIDPEIHAATVRLLTKCGADIDEEAGARCCGALNHHLGQTEQARRFAERNTRTLAPRLKAKELDWIVSTVSGCGAHLKDYGFQFRSDPTLSGPAETVSGHTRDVTEVLAVLPAQVFRAPRRLRVAYQSACALNHGQKLDLLPRRLLAEAGFDVLELEESHLCCGSAGTYNLLQPEISERLRARKTAQIAKLRPDIVASGNIGCMTHLKPALDVPICHTVQLLDWALGGPAPPGIDEVEGP